MKIKEVHIDTWLSPMEFECLIDALDMQLEMSDDSDVIYPEHGWTGKQIADATRRARTKLRGVEEAS